MNSGLSQNSHSHNKHNSPNHNSSDNERSQSSNSGKRRADHSPPRSSRKKSKQSEDNSDDDFEIDYDAEFRAQSEREREQDEDEHGVTGYTNTLDINELKTEVKKHKADRGTKRALAKTVQTITANIRQKTKSSIIQKKNLQILLNTYDIPKPDPWNVTMARDWLAVHYITHGMPIDN